MDDFTFCRRTNIVLSASSARIVYSFFFVGVFARTSESENQDDKISNSFSFVLFFLFARCGFCWDNISSR